MNWVLCAALLVTSVFLVFGNSDDYEDEEEEILSSNSTANATLIFTKSLENVTVESRTKVVKLVCAVQNLDPNNTDSKVTFSWRKNMGQLEKSKNRVTVKTIKEINNTFRSTLRLQNLELFDRAFYDCTATNGVHTIRSTALVEVTSDGHWGSTSPLNIGGGGGFDGEITTTPQGAGTIFDANLVGIPKKDQLEQALKNGVKTFDLTPAETEHKVVIKKNFTSEPFCQVYSGKTCGHYLENRYVFVQPPFSQSEIEQKLTNAFLVISQSNDISSSCNKYAHPSLCYSAFPLCDSPRHVNLYQTEKPARFKDSDFRDIRNQLKRYLRRICRDDCLLLETELCSKEYSIAKRHPVIGQTLKLEECQFLPEQSDKSSAQCLSLEVNRENVDKEDTCYWDDGQLYKGVQDTSETGKKCLTWSHMYKIDMSNHPELSGHNYCRNPDGEFRQPFCYVDRSKTEVCNITKCPNIIIMYVLIFSVVILIIISLIVVCCYYKRKSRTGRNLQNMNVPTADKNIYGNPGPNSPMELNNLLPPNIPPQRNHHGSKTGYQNVPQYTYKEVAFIEELGEGAFGKVYKGELKTKAGKIFVAVKSLKENASAKTQADFQREIELISELKHPNIICLMGVVVKQEPMCMLFEFMSEGDLHEFLIANSPSEGKSLTQNQFLHVAIQIAQGMEYLSDNHYVHRDLAARNCLVSKELVVKISDFGLSRDMYSCDYYRVQSKSLLPVRWMPPESILYGKFTTESDVWSYGVVLWEIYSYGLQPYYGYNNQEVINMIRSRKLLPCPDACPSYCYALMVECWAELAIRRPSFGEISHRLRIWKQNGNSNGAYFKTPPEPRFGHGSKSSRTSDSPATTTMAENNETWDRSQSLSMNGGKGLRESQTSLTSRCSSLGNKTQSTSLSNERGGKRVHRRNEDSLDRAVKNTVVSQNGESFEIRVTQ